MKKNIAWLPFLSLLFFMFFSVMTGIVVWRLRRQSPPTPPPEAVLPSNVSRHIRVMTFNINMIEPTAGPRRWQIQKRLLPMLLQKYQPDIIGFQACTPVQTAWLGEHLRRYRHYPAPGSLAGNLFSALSGAIETWNQIFYSVRFKLLAGAHGLVQPRDLRNNATENAYYSLVVLHDKLGKIPNIILLDTHLRHGNPNAAKDAAMLHRIVAHWHRRFPTALSIVLGDMNHPRTDTPVYSALIKPIRGLKGDAQWSDTFDYALRQKGHWWGTVQYYVGRPGLRWPSDLILVSPKWDFDPAKIIRYHGPHGAYPSDHFPVLTVLTPEK